MLTDDSLRSFLNHEAARGKKNPFDKLFVPSYNDLKKCQAGKVTLLNVYDKLELMQLPFLHVGNDVCIINTMKKNLISVSTIIFPQLEKSLFMSKFRYYDA